MKTSISEKEAAFIAEHLADDVAKLLLKYSKDSSKDLDVAFCCHQIECRRRFSAKLPSIVAFECFVFPPLMNVEQTSSEQTALYKSELIESDCRMIDLTCGLGIDAYFFAKRASSVLCVEKLDWLSEVTKHNFDLIGVRNCECVSADCVEELDSLPCVDVIYIDPARRDANARRLYAIKDCVPDVASLQEKLLDKAPHIIIKLSPMLDLKSVQRDLHSISDIHVVSLENECKEILVEVRRGFVGDLRFHAVDISKSNRQSLVMDSSSEKMNLCSNNLTLELGRFIYEPSASLLKIGSFGALMEKYGLKKLHPHSHLFTCEDEIADFQGRGFELLEQRKANAKALKDIKKANISVRNFPQTVEELRRKTGIKEGGEIYLFFTTLENEEKVCLVCSKIKKTK